MIASAELVEERRKKDPDRIVLLRHEENRGVGGSIVSLTGFAAELYGLFVEPTRLHFGPDP